MTCRHLGRRVVANWAIVTLRDHIQRYEPQCSTTWLSHKAPTPTGRVVRLETVNGPHLPLDNLDELGLRHGGRDVAEEHCWAMGLGVLGLPSLAMGLRGVALVLPLAALLGK